MEIVPKPIRNRMEIEQKPIGNLPEITAAAAAEKNRFLAPAEPVPQLDREVAQAMEQAIGLLQPEPSEEPPAPPTPEGEPGQNDGQHR